MLGECLNGKPLIQMFCQLTVDFLDQFRLLRTVLRQCMLFGLHIREIEQQLLDFEL